MYSVTLDKKFLKKHRQIIPHLYLGPATGIWCITTCCQMTTGVRVRVRVRVSSPHTIPVYALGALIIQCMWLSLVDHSFYRVICLRGPDNVTVYCAAVSTGHFGLLEGGNLIKNCTNNFLVKTWHVFLKDPFILNKYAYFIEECVTRVMHANLLCMHLKRFRKQLVTINFFCEK